MHKNTHEFYRDLWQAISFEDDTFYSDSSRNFHSYTELKKIYTQMSRKLLKEIFNKK